MIIIYGGITFLLLVATLATVYVLTLAVTACLVSWNTRLPSSKKRHRFAVVIPAHDEAANIVKTLHAIRRLDYPVSGFSIIVVADNCTDDTAAKSLDAGVRVLSRNDPDHHGKGYALGYAFERLLAEGFDAIVVVDADTVPAPNLLDSFDRRLAAGQNVLQAVYGVENPDASHLTYLLHVGNFMENYLFQFPKNVFGLPVILRGNGMCFSTDVLRNYPWHAHSVVEDTEYSLELLRAGEFVHFVTETAVYGEYPSSLEQLHSQRVRWASGNGSMLKKYALGLLWRGAVRRNLALADTGWSLLVSSKPLLMISVVMPTVLALVFQGPSGSLFLWGCVLVVGLAVYLMIGVMLAGASLARLKSFAHLPNLVAHMTRYAVMGLFGYRQNVWTRTKRT